MYIKMGLFYALSRHSVELKRFLLDLAISDRTFSQKATKINAKSYHVSVVVKVAQELPILQVLKLFL